MNYLNKLMVKYVLPAVFAVGAMTGNVDAKESKKSVDATVEHCYKAFEGKASGDEKNAAIVSTIDRYFKRTNEKESPQFALENGRMYVFDYDASLNPSESVYEFDLGLMLRNIKQRSNRATEKVCVHVPTDLTKYFKKVDTKDASKFVEGFSQTPTDYFLSQEYGVFLNDVYDVKKASAALIGDAKKVGDEFEATINSVDATLDELDADMELIRDSIKSVAPSMDTEESLFGDEY
jgi:hypothetical protein